MLIQQPRPVLLRLLYPKIIIPLYKCQMVNEFLSDELRTGKFREINDIQDIYDLLGKSFQKTLKKFGSKMVKSLTVNKFSAKTQNI